MYKIDEGNVQPNFHVVVSISDRRTLKMSSLKLQKRLAAGVMKCGKNKVSAGD